MKLSEEQRLELLRRLNEITGVDLPIDSIDRFPSIPLSTLAKDDALERLFKAIEWVNDEVKKGKPRNTQKRSVGQPITP